MAELEQRLRLAVTGDRSALINQLLDENARLRHKVDVYRARLESIVQAGQECLAEEDDMPREKNNTDDGAAEEVSAQAVEDRRFEFIPSIDSVLHEISSFSSMSSGETDLAAEESVSLPDKEVIDAVTTWKMFSGKGAAGLDFISERLWMASNPPNLSLSLGLSHPIIAADGISPLTPTLDDLDRAVLSESIYGDILEHLLYDAPSPIERSRGSPGSESLGTVSISEIERQRRAVAICACENSRRWRRYFRSMAEYIALFWAQYRYYLFLVCPTTENYEKCLPWHRPQPAQFATRHPSFIDFLVWPRLRAYLAQNWQGYSAHDLIASLIKNFEVRYPGAQHGCWIKATSDPSGLELDESFERVIRNIDSFITHDEFRQQYPDLFAFVNPTTQQPCMSPTHRHAITPRTHAFPLNRVTKSSRRIVAAKVKRNLQSVCFDEGAADEEIQETFLTGNDGMSRPSEHTDTSMDNQGQDTSQYPEHHLFPLDTMFETSELSALASMANLDFETLLHDQEGPDMDMDLVALQRQQSPPRDLLGIGSISQYQFRGDL
ncbi:hypothetical protein IL306_004159 [Fusarium sp. DS 682]|nr:hypothetical protein IL306_004159 [Fusarium sp. DS 682]